MNVPKLCTKDCQERSSKNCATCNAHKTPEQLNDIAIEIDTIIKNMCAKEDCVSILIDALKLENAVNDFINCKLHLLIN